MLQVTIDRHDHLWRWELALRAALKADLDQLVTLDRPEALDPLEALAAGFLGALVSLVAMAMGAEGWD